jgi:hypothetical protein
MAHEQIMEEIIMLTRSALERQRSAAGGELGGDQCGCEGLGVVPALLQPVRNSQVLELARVELREEEVKVERHGTRSVGR